MSALVRSWRERAILAVGFEDSLRCDFSQFGGMLQESKMLELISILAVRLVSNAPESECIKKARPWALPLKKVVSNATVTVNPSLPLPCISSLVFLPSVTVLVFLLSLLENLVGDH